MTFREILDQGLFLAGEDEGGDYEDALKVWVNRFYYAVLEEVSSQNEQREFSLTTVAGTSKYGLPLLVEKPLNFEDPDNDRSLEVVSPRRFDQTTAGTDDSGTPDYVYWYGAFGVQAQPETSGVITVVSSSALDVTYHSLVVTGFVDGVWSRESVTVTGTTPASTTKLFDADNGIERLVRVVTSASTWTGDLTITDSDGNTLSVIPAYWQDSPTYQWVELDPTPAAAITYVVRCEAKKPPLIYDSDWPDLPDSYHDLLVSGPSGYLLPSVGKTTTGDRQGGWYTRRLDKFSGKQDRRPGRIRTLADVTINIGRGAPGAPRIDPFAG